MVLHFVALSLFTSAATVSHAETSQEATRPDTLRAALADCVATVQKEGHSHKWRPEAHGLVFLWRRVGAMDHNSWMLRLTCCGLQG